MHREIYLDNSATTRQYEEVTELVYDVARNTYGNPSSLHTKGIEAERLVKKAREIIAGSLCADPKEVLFTSGGTESNNLAIRGFLEANPRKGRHIITTRVEHPSVLEVFKKLKEDGFYVDFADVDGNGVIDLEGLKGKIREDTALISVIAVNNETGSIQPVEEIIRIKNSINKNTAIHADAVQAYGKIPLMPGKAGIDLLSASSHKLHGPKGVGILYVSGSTRIKPMLYGGGQEALLRSGTENVPGIAGFSLAAKITFERLEQNAVKVAGLKADFIERLGSCSFDYRVVSPAASSPYILNIAFSGLKAEVLLHHLEERGIFVSTGSACSSRKKSRSHVLTSMGLPPDLVDGAVRFSFSSLNDIQDVADTIDALNDIIPRIQIKRKRTGGSQ